MSTVLNLGLADVSSRLGSVYAFFSGNTQKWCVLFRRRTMILVSANTGGDVSFDRSSTTLIMLAARNSFSMRAKNGEREREREREQGRNNRREGGMEEGCSL